MKKFSYESILLAYGHSNTFPHWIAVSLDWTTWEPIKAVHERRNYFSKLELESDFRYAKFNYLKELGQEANLYSHEAQYCFLNDDNEGNVYFPHHLYTISSLEQHSLFKTFKYTQWFCIMSLLFSWPFLPNWPGLV